MPLLLVLSGIARPGAEPTRDLVVGRCAGAGDFANRVWVEEEHGVPTVPLLDLELLAGLRLDGWGLAGRIR